MLPPDFGAAIDAVVDREAPALRKLCSDIHQNPELRFEEVKAAAWMTDLLASRGFDVTRGLAGMPTAFAARAGRPGGPKVGVLAEYDALPEIGHACGHNLIATGAIGAFLAAASVAERAGGEVVVFGTPAEEGGGGKIKMLEAGCFQDLDAAIMFHPFDRDVLAHPALASLWLTFTFRGKPAHAAIAPHDGKSALTACLAGGTPVGSRCVGTSVRLCTQDNPNCGCGRVSVVAPPPPNGQCEAMQCVSDSARGELAQGAPTGGAGMCGCSSVMGGI